MSIKRQIGEFFHQYQERLKADNQFIKRLLRGRIVWAGNWGTYRRDEPKLTKAGKRAQKRGRVAILKLRGGRHVMHPMHVAQKAAVREVQP